MSVPTISKSILTDRNTNYSEQSTIEINITPEMCPLLNTSQGTYLKFLLTMDKNTANCLAQPDPMAGGSAIIQTISIYSNSGQLLEQLEDFNVWTAMKYHYSKTQGEENMRTLMEGVSPIIGQSLKSQYFDFNPVGSTTYKQVECVVPLYMSGLLGQGQKLLPIIAFGGLRVRIQLAKKEACLRALTQVGYSSTAATYTGIEQVDGLPVAGSYAAKSFEVGLVKAAGAQTFIDLNTVGQAPVVALSNADTIQVLANQSNCAYMIGQDLWCELPAVGVTFNLGPITGVILNGTTAQYQFASVVVPAGGIAVGAKVWVDANSLKNNFIMSNVEMVCSVVQANGATISGLMNQVQNGGGIKLDYPSYNLYRQNLQADIPRSELLIPCTEQRAMSIVSGPMTSINNIYQDTLRPVGDAMQSYIWNIANRLTPNRRVSTLKVAAENAVQTLKWDSIHLHETEKAIGRCDIRPRNLCANARYFVVARELAKEGHSFDANTNEIRLNVEYGSGATENKINKLVDTWLYHLRTVTITPNSVAVTF